MAIYHSMEKLLNILRAAADPTRLRIIRMLGVKPMCVCEVMSVLGIAQSTASKHLRILADAGLASSKSAGAWTIYETTCPVPSSPEARLMEMIGRAETTEQLRRDEAAAKKADRFRICRKQSEMKPKKKKGTRHDRERSNRIEA